MARKRDVLEQLKREELQGFAAHYDLDVEDRRVRDHLVDALTRARRAPLREMLEGFSRDRLKAICVGLDLDDSGREKALIIDRICGEQATVDDDDDRESADAEDDEEQHRQPESHETADLLHRLIGHELHTIDPSSSWPLRAMYRAGEADTRLDIYTRAIGGSSRGNPQERRFQNPSQRSPITIDRSAIALLLGIWTEQGEDRAVLVAMDPHRRADRATRFSLFMPLALLETALDTGFATHENSKGEVLYAFRPENLRRYLATVAQGVGAPVPYQSARAPQRVPVVADNVQTSELNIRPRVGMYSAFARLNYKPWFALAEFVDNSIQSFLNDRARLSAMGHEGPLVIDVNLDETEISITDRAGGIAWKDFPRAFSPAAPPDDPSGLSEFGLGMKAAACWFARKWTVTTSALGEDLERTVMFDVPKISRDGVERLPIETRPTRPADHFTRVTLRDLRVRPRGRTLSKVKEHLASIYRVLINEGIVRIRFTASGQSEELRYEPPELLVAPYYRTPEAAPVRWRKEILYDLGDRKVTGWAGIMVSGSYARAGFSVFRRGRLIEGSVDETFKPRVIFGAPNSFASQRVVGELYVDGFNVTHTKDGIQWDGYDGEILQAIRGQLDSADMMLLEQASGYRARKTGASLPANFGSAAMAALASELTLPAAAQAVRGEIGRDPLEEEPREPPAMVAGPTQTRTFAMNIVRDAKPWQIEFELIRDPAHPFYSTGAEERDGAQVIKVRVNLEHELSVLHINENEDALQPVLRLVAALALGETIARQSGVTGAGAVRRNANEILAAVARHPAS